MARRKTTLTEEEWLEKANPLKMVSFLRASRASERKLRLFGCACCRGVWNLLPNDASRKAVEVAERFADKFAKRRDLNQAALACAGEAVRSSHNPAEAVVKVSLQWAAWITAYNAQVLAAGTGPFQASELARHLAAEEMEGRQQRKLLHDIFGNPFGPVAIDPACLTWNGGTIPKLAQAVYDERLLPAGHLDPVRLAVLADALEEAGCTDDAVLSHCREPGEHVRGCWLVDLLRPEYR
jgi:hypothetical protein